MIGISVGLFLLLFWGGIILMALALTNVLAVSVLTVLIIWLIVMALYLVGWFLFIKKATEYCEWQKATKCIDQAEEVARSKILRMHQEDAERRMKYMYHENE